MKNILKCLRLFLLAIFTNFLFVSCSVDKEFVKTSDEVNSNDKKSKPLILHDNVKIINEDHLTLDMNPKKLSVGVYEFSGKTDSSETISVGDVIVGGQGSGFLRKVTEVATSKGKITLHTVQGTLKQLFKSGNLRIELSDTQLRQSSNSTKNTVSTNIAHNFSPKVLYEGALNLTLDSGYARFYPNWVFDIQYDDEPGYTDGLDFKCLAENSRFDTNFKITATSTGQFTLVPQEISLLNAPYVKTITRWVPATLGVVPVLVPVTFVITVDLLANFTASTSTAASRSATFNSSSNFTFGIKYENSEWSAPNTFIQTNSVTLSPWTSNANLNVMVGIGPKASVKLYGIVGPNVSLSLETELDANVSLVDNNWDVKADAWLKTSGGVDATILGTTYDYAAPSYETDKISYIAPFKIEPVSGDNQIGLNGLVLPQPVRVRALDNFNNPLQNVNINFATVIGGGSVTPSGGSTDSDGNAQANWILGNSGVEQQITVSAKKADGTPLLNSPVSFSATATATLSPCDDATTPYPTVTIGGQVWMQKNLNVCKYRNGDDIPQVQDPTAWAALTTGAWCYYQNNTDNGPVYGKLYNWFAVNDPRGLAPAGYHVPTDTEWSTLINFLDPNANGGNNPNVAGGKMKATGTIQAGTGLWQGPNTGATNSSGFTGLPSGFRNGNGSFNSIGIISYFWSSSERDTFYSWDRYIKSDTSNATRNYLSKPDGFAVRCLSD